MNNVTTIKNALIEKNVIPFCIKGGRRLALPLDILRKRLKNEIQICKEQLPHKIEVVDSEFKKLYLILSKDSIFADIPAKLKQETQFHEEKISDKFYNDYSSFKHKIFNNLIKNNPQYDRLLLFKKSQKLLDRLLFVYFAEDCGLVPPNAISRIIDQWNQLKELEAWIIELAP